MKDGYYYVYMLLCRDGKYYTGVTNDLERRVAEHQEGYDPKSFTHRRRPVRLVYFEAFQEINQAIDWEKRLKKWSARKKKALIDEDFEKIVQFSKKNFGK